MTTLIDHACWNCGKPGFHVYAGKYVCSACDVEWTENLFWDENNDVWRSYAHYRKHRIARDRAYKRNWRIESFVDFTKQGAPSCP